MCASRYTDSRPWQLESERVCVWREKDTAAAAVAPAQVQVKSSEVRQSRPYDRLTDRQAIDRRRGGEEGSGKKEEEREKKMRGRKGFSSPVLTFFKPIPQLLCQSWKEEEEKSRFLPFPPSPSRRRLQFVVEVNTRCLYENIGLAAKKCL